MAFLDEPGHERRRSIGADSEVPLDKLSVNARQHHRYPEKIVIGERRALLVLSPCSQVPYSVEEQVFYGQTVAVAISIEFFNRLTVAADMPASRATARTPLARRQFALGSFLLGLGDWRTTESSRQAPGGRLTPKYPIPTGLAEVEGHHLRQVEQRQATRPGGIQRLLDPATTIRRPSGTLP
jgi:hypothetical protein